MISINQKHLPPQTNVEWRKSKQTNKMSTLQQSNFHHDNTGQGTQKNMIPMRTASIIHRYFTGSFLTVRKKTLISL